MNDYERFSAALNKKVQRKKYRIMIKRFILIQLEKYLPFLALLGGSICLQIGWGEFKLVKLFWILTAAAFAFATWYVIDDLRFIFGKDEKDD